MKTYRPMTRKEYAALKESAKALGFKMSITRGQSGMKGVLIRPSASDITVLFNEDQVNALNTLIKAYNLNSTVPVEVEKYWWNYRGGFGGLVVFES